MLQVVTEQMLKELLTLLKSIKYLNQYIHNHALSQ